MKNTQFFSGLKTLKAIKDEYKHLVKIHHPDVGGDTATMQEINRQYGDAIDWIKKHGEGFEQAAARQEVPEKYAAAVAAVVNLAGIDVDLVGSWIWVTGSTYLHKDIIKAAGYRWASKKRAWYWRPEDCAVSRSSKKSLDEIKDKYGFTRLEGRGIGSLSA